MIICPIYFFGAEECLSSPYAGTHALLSLLCLTLLCDFSLPNFSGVSDLSPEIDLALNDV